VRVKPLLSTHHLRAKHHFLFWGVFQSLTPTAPYHGFISNIASLVDAYTACGQCEVRDASLSGPLLRLLKCALGTQFVVQEGVTVTSRSIFLLDFN